MTTITALQSTARQIMERIEDKYELLQSMVALRTMLAHTSEDDTEDRIFLYRKWIEIYSPLYPERKCEHANQ